MRRSQLFEDTPMRHSRSSADADFDAPRERLHPLLAFPVMVAMFAVCGVVLGFIGWVAAVTFGALQRWAG